MGLFSKNNNEVVITSEDISAMKESILEGNFVEIQIPSIKTITDNILAAKEVTLFGNRPLDAATSGISTIWNITSLTFGEYACCIELGGLLFPYEYINFIMKHPINGLRYGLVLKNGNIINFNFSDELQCLGALEVFKDKGIRVIE